MNTVATILIPTHDHGPTLRYSIASTLDQTIDEIEIFVVGDGVPDVTREIMADFMRYDRRVRFFDNPKGPRHGEILRHAALQDAQGEIVCYLSDDDLYLPDHIEIMVAQLRDFDFAHALPLKVSPDGEFRVWTCDLERQHFLDLIQSGQNLIPLSCGAHRLDYYRVLPYGWRTSPVDTATDLYMWQQLLAQPGGRFASGFYPTVLHFPSPARAGYSNEKRSSELSDWYDRVTNPTWRPVFVEQVLERVVKKRMRLERYAKSNAGARARGG